MRKIFSAIAAVLLLPLLCFTLSAQDVGITLRMDNAPLVKVIDRVEQLSGYSFIYTNQVVDEHRVVSLDVRNADILTVLDIDNTPLMLGMILEDIMEQNFVTASMSYDRNYSIFITRPISAVILIITVVLLVSMIRVNRRVAKLNEQQEAEMAAEHAKMENA